MENSDGANGILSLDGQENDVVVNGVDYGLIYTPSYTGSATITFSSPDYPNFSIEVLDTTLGGFEFEGSTSGG